MYENVWNLVDKNMYCTESCVTRLDHTLKRWRRVGGPIKIVNLTLLKLILRYLIL